MNNFKWMKCGAWPSVDFIAEKNNKYQNFPMWDCWRQRLLRKVKWNVHPSVVVMANGDVWWQKSFTVFISKKAHSTAQYSLNVIMLKTINTFEIANAIFRLYFWLIEDERKLNHWHAPATILVGNHRRSHWNWIKRQAYCNDVHRHRAKWKSREEWRGSYIGILPILLYITCSGLTMYSMAQWHSDRTTEYPNVHKSATTSSAPHTNYNFRMYNKKKRNKREAKKYKYIIRELHKMLMMKILCGTAKGKIHANKTHCNHENA